MLKFFRFQVYRNSGILCLGCYISGESGGTSAPIDRWTTKKNVKEKKDSQSKSESPKTSLSQIITDFECKFLIPENIDQASMKEQFTYKIISENFGYSRVNLSRTLIFIEVLIQDSKHHNMRHKFIFYSKSATIFWWNSPSLIIRIWQLNLTYLCSLWNLRRF